MGGGVGGSSVRVMSAPAKEEEEEEEGVDLVGDCYLLLLLGRRRQCVCIIRTRDGEVGRRGWNKKES